jgi:peptidoglycan/xylan/chitin deacetylase (PgdA/CDA1 family)
LTVATVAVAVAAGLFGAGQLMSRVAGPPPGGGTATGTGSTGVRPDPAARVGSEAGQQPAPEPVPAQLSLPARPVAMSQPVTGPGRPPLPMTGTGPHGTLRTTGGAYLALTFDDGPDPRWTPAVLKLLREHRARATFCVVGRLAREHPELVRQIAADGHTLCNHGWDHDLGLGSRSRAEIRADLRRTNAAVRKAVPLARVSYFRQPGGAWTRRVVRVAEEQGMSSLHWAVDPRDWSRPGPGAIAEAVTAGARAGGIVLLHDGGGERRSTVRALGRILPELAGRLSVDALPPGVDPPRHHGRELPLKPGQV